jgi:HPt (histidine-containing phosphotransfer) domain-containing protein
MTVQECYSAMGANYDEITRRLMNDERIRRFLLKFLDDPSFAALCSAMEEQKVEEAFRAAHTLKGVSKNMAMTRLGNSVEQLTEQLRGRTEYGTDLEAQFEIVKADYAITKQAIQALS